MYYHTFQKITPKVICKCFWILINLNSQFTLLMSLELVTRGIWKHLPWVSSMDLFELGTYLSLGNYDSAPLVTTHCSSSVMHKCTQTVTLNKFLSPSLLKLDVTDCQILAMLHHRMLFWQANLTLTP